MVAFRRWEDWKPVRQQALMVKGFWCWVGLFVWNVLERSEGMFNSTLEIRRGTEAQSKVAFLPQIGHGLLLRKPALVEAAAAFLPEESPMTDRWGESEIGRGLLHLRKQTRRKEGLSARTAFKLKGAITSKGSCRREDDQRTEWS